MIYANHRKMRQIFKELLFFLKIFLILIYGSLTTPDRYPCRWQSIGCKVVACPGQIREDMLCVYKSACLSGRVKWSGRKVGDLRYQTSLWTESIF